MECVGFKEDKNRQTNMKSRKESREKIKMERKKNTHTDKKYGRGKRDAEGREGIK